jgi:hypothetical protein
MFEGKKIQRRMDAPDEGGGRLRELHWADLVAQLAATRDLRGVMDSKLGDNSAAGRFKSLNAGAADTPVHPSQSATTTADRFTPPTVTHRASSRNRDSR